MLTHLKNKKSACMVSFEVNKAHKYKETDTDYIIDNFSLNNRYSIFHKMGCHHGFLFNMNTRDYDHFWGHDNLRISPNKIVSKTDTDKLFIEEQRELILNDTLVLTYELNGQLFEGFNYNSRRALKLNGILYLVDFNAMPFSISTSRTDTYLGYVRVLKPYEGEPYESYISTSHLNEMNSEEMDRMIAHLVQSKNELFKDQFNLTDSEYSAFYYHLKGFKEEEIYQRLCRLDSTFTFKKVGNTKTKIKTKFEKKFIECFENVHRHVDIFSLLDRSYEITKNSL